MKCPNYICKITDHPPAAVFCHICGRQFKSEEEKRLDSISSWVYYSINSLMFLWIAIPSDFNSLGKMSKIIFSIFSLLLGVVIVFLWPIIVKNANNIYGANKPDYTLPHYKLNYVYVVFFVCSAIIVKTFDKWIGGAFWLSFVIFVLIHYITFHYSPYLMFRLGLMDEHITQKPRLKGLMLWIGLPAIAVTAFNIYNYEVVGRDGSRSVSRDEGRGASHSSGTTTGQDTGSTFISQTNSIPPPVPTPTPEERKRRDEQRLQNERSVRIGAIENITDQAVLAEIVRTDESIPVRLAAVKALTDQAVLADIAKNDEYYGVRAMAEIRLMKDQAALAEFARSGNVFPFLLDTKDYQVAAIEMITDQKILADIGRSNTFPITIDVQKAAVKKITDQRILEEIVKTATDEKPILAAIERITNQAMLEKIANNAEDIANRLQSSTRAGYNSGLLFKGASFRSAAVWALTDQRALGRIAQTHEHRGVKSTASIRLEMIGKSQTKLLGIAMPTDREVVQQVAAVKQMTDQSLLAKIAQFVDTEHFYGNGPQVEALKKITDQKILADMVRLDAPLRAEIAEVEKITDQKKLAEIATTHEDFPIRRMAVKKLTDQSVLEKIAKTDVDDWREMAVRASAVVKVTDQNVLAEIALKNDEYGSLGWSAVYEAVLKITDQAVLEKVAKNDKDWRVRKVAVTRITNPTVLDEIEKNEKNDYFGGEVRRAVTQRKSQITGDKGTHSNSTTTTTRQGIPNRSTQISPPEPARPPTPAPSTNRLFRTTASNTLTTRPPVNVTPDVNVKNAAELFDAADKGITAKLRELIVTRADANAKNKDDVPLIVKVTGNSYGYNREDIATDIIKLLLERGADVNAQDKNGNTALITAVNKRSIELIQTLLRAPGIDVNAKNKDGHTALIVSVESSGFGINENSVKLLLDAGADANVKDKNGVPVIIKVTSKNDFGGKKLVEIAKLLVGKGGNIHTKDTNGNTALITAVKEGRINLVEYFLNMGADPNVKNNKGETALLLAAALYPDNNDNVAIVKNLLAKGANIQDKNTNYETPFDISKRRYGPTNKIAILLDKPLLCTQCNGKGLTVCSGCQGTGTIRTEQSTRCASCLGRGTTTRTVSVRGRLTTQQVRCGSCSGTGQRTTASTGLCQTCRGTRETKCTSCDGIGRR